jgi:uncharacterized protein YkwD
VWAPTTPARKTAPTGVRVTHGRYDPGVPGGKDSSTTAQRWALPALAALLLAVAAPAAAQALAGPVGHVASAPRARSARACVGANLIPRPHNLGAVEAATLCLINRERTTRGLRALHNNRALTRSAEQHTQEMLSRNYFADSAPSGITLIQRATLSGFRNIRYGAPLSEVIATAGGRLATPRSIVNAWMTSPPHREALLRRAYRVSGLGIAPGMPSSSAGGWGGPGGTYTDDLGS